MSGSPTEQSAGSLDAGGARVEEVFQQMLAARGFSADDFTIAQKRAKAAPKRAPKRKRGEDVALLAVDGADLEGCDVTARSSDITDAAAGASL